MTANHVEQQTRSGVNEEELWAAARTLRDYAALTAQWLEGRIATQPGYIGGVDVDEDMAPGLTETLVLLNRFEIVTTESQAGAVSTGPDNVRWAQVAAVLGLATRETAEWLSQQLAGTRFQTVISPVRHASDGEFYGTPVTFRNDDEYTWFGPVSDLMAIPVDAEVAVAIYDPAPGPNELWTALRTLALRRLGHGPDAA